MNSKLLLALLGLLAAATATVEGSSSSSSSDVEATIPLCNQRELVAVADLMTTNLRKKECEKALNVKEMVRANDTKKLCSLAPCTAALKELYVELPNCRYEDWGIKYHIGRLLKTCAIDPDMIDPSSLSGNNSGSTDLGSGSGSGSNIDPPVDFSPSSSNVTFAPLPTAAPVVTPAPSETQSGSIVYGATVAAAVTVAVGVLNAL